MPLRRSIVLCVLLGALILGWLRWRDVRSRKQPGETAGPVIDKQPVHFETRTFDPAAPPADMPPLNSGEYAECDSNFLSSGNVGGETQSGTLESSPSLDVSALCINMSLPVAVRESRKHNLRGS